MWSNRISALFAHRRLWRWCWLLAAFLPAVPAWQIIADNVVNIGCWDMWENAPLLEGWHDGTLRWADLHAAQIQHRIVVPRLIIIALHTLSGGDFRWESWFAFGVLCLTACLVWRLLRRTVGDSAWVPGLLLAGNLLIFSPMLYQNVLWGSGMWMTLPVPLLLASILVLRQDSWPLAARLAAVVVLAELATHSFAHGLCVWPVLIVHVAAQPALGSLRRRLVAAGVLTLVAAATFAAYFHDFTNQAVHAYGMKPGDPALGERAVAHDWGRVATVTLGILGSLFSRNPFEPQPPIDAAPRIGAWLLAVFALLALVLVGTKKGRQLWRVALPWLAVAAYAFGVALMVGFGRSNIGEFRAVAPRYLAMSSHFWLATGVLAFLVVRHFAAGLVAPRRETARRAGLVALTVAVVAQVPCWQYGAHLSRVWSRARWQALAHSMFVDHFTFPRGTATQNVLDMDQDYCRRAIHTLRRIGLYKTPVLEKPELSAFGREAKPLPPDRGAVESVTARADDGSWEIRGNARFGIQQPADLVLIVPAGEPTVVAVGQFASTPALRLYGLDYEFANAEPLPHSLWSRWTAHLPASAAPASGRTLEVWALDARAMTVTRLSTGLRLSGGEDGGRVLEIVPDSQSGEPDSAPPREPK